MSTQENQPSPDDCEHLVNPDDNVSGQLRYTTRNPAVIARFRRAVNQTRFTRATDNLEVKEAINCLTNDYFRDGCSTDRKTIDNTHVKLVTSIRSVDTRVDVTTSPAAQKHTLPEPRTGEEKTVGYRLLERESPEDPRPLLIYDGPVDLKDAYNLHKDLFDFNPADVTIPREIQNQTPILVPLARAAKKGPDAELKELRRYAKDRHPLPGLSWPGKCHQDFRWQAGHDMTTTGQATIIERHLQRLLNNNISGLNVRQTRESDVTAAARTFQPFRFYNPLPTAGIFPGDHKPPPPDREVLFPRHYSNEYNPNNPNNAKTTCKAILAMQHDILKLCTKETLERVRDLPAFTHHHVNKEIEKIDRAAKHRVPEQQTRDVDINTLPEIETISTKILELRDTKAFILRISTNARLLELVDLEPDHPDNNLCIFNNEQVKTELDARTARFNDLETFLTIHEITEKAAEKMDKKDEAILDDPVFDTAILLEKQRKNPRHKDNLNINKRIANLDIDTLATTINNLNRNPLPHLTDLIVKHASPERLQELFCTHISKGTTEQTKELGLILITDSRSDMATALKQTGLANWKTTPDEKRGKTTFLFAPGNKESHRWNPIDMINIRLPEGDGLLDIMAETLIPNPPGKIDHYWITGARTILKTAILDLKANAWMEPTPDTTLQNVITWIDRLADPEELNRMQTEYKDKCESNPLYPRHIFNLTDISKIPHKQRAGGIAILTRNLSVYNNPVILATLAQSDFDLFDTDRKEITICAQPVVETEENLQPLLTLFYLMIDEKLQQLPAPEPDH